MSDQHPRIGSPGTHFEKGIPILPRPVDEAEAKALADKEVEEAYKGRQLTLNMWTVFFTAALFLCTVLTAYIYTRQLETMNEQLREMKGSSIQTDRLLDIQEKQLTEFQSQASDTRDLAVAAARQANAAGVIASNAASQSKATAALADSAVSQLGVMRGQFEISQRPWLSLTGAISGPLTFDANGANFIFRFTVHNSGQTPAVNFILLPELKALNLSLDVVAEARNFCAASKTPFDEAAGRGTIFPGADRVQDIAVSTGPDEIQKKSFPGQLTFSPVLIACVPYQASFDRSKWYYTAKIFNIERRIPGQVGIYAFRLYEPVEMQNMSLSTFGYPEMAR